MHTHARTHTSLFQRPLITHIEVEAAFSLGEEKGQWWNGLASIKQPEKASAITKCYVLDGFVEAASAQKSVTTPSIPS